MSGTSYDNPCPNCGQPMNCFSNYKPFDTVNGECLNCGFCYYTKTDQMSLNDLNYQRKDYNKGMGYKKGDEEYLPPIKKIPECDLKKI